MEYTDAFDSTKMNVEFQEKKNVVRFSIKKDSFPGWTPEIEMADLNIFELIKLRDELNDIIKSYGLD